MSVAVTPRRGLAALGAVGLPLGLAAAPAAAPAATWGPAPAGAVVTDYAPRDAGAGIVPSTAATSTRGLFSPQTVQQRYVISTGSGYITLRNTAGAFAIAEGANGWGFDASDRSNSSWYFGYVGGSANTCAYAQTSSIPTPTNGAWQGDCGNRDNAFRPSAFMTQWNGNGNCTQAPDGHTECDGSPIRTTATCNLWANVQPWYPGHGVGSSTGYSVPSGTTVNWRYVTKDGQYMMVRDANSNTVPANSNDWGFMSTSCLPAVSGQPPTS